MGWLSKILGSVLKEEMSGISVDIDQLFWEVDGPKTFPEMVRALDGWLPANSVLYFEGGSPDKSLKHYLNKNAIPEQTRVAFGTIWPRSLVYHIPARHELIEALANLMENHVESELAIHFHVYKAGRMLLEWHDAFSQPMLISGDISEEKVKDLAHRLGTRYQKGRTKKLSLS